MFQTTATKLGADGWRDLGALVNAKTIDFIGEILAQSVCCNDTTRVARNRTSRAAVWVTAPPFLDLA